MLPRKRTPVSGILVDDDAVLLDGIRRSVLADFEKLFHASWDPLCQYAFYYLRSTDDAEEVVQGVFARIWENRFDWSVRGTSLADGETAKSQKCAAVLRAHRRKRIAWSSPESLRRQSSEHLRNCPRNGAESVSFGFLRACRTWKSRRCSISPRRRSRPRSREASSICVRAWWICGRSNSTPATAWG